MAFKFDPEFKSFDDKTFFLNSLWILFIRILTKNHDFDGHLPRPKKIIYYVSMILTILY